MPIDELLDYFVERDKTCSEPVPNLQISAGGARGHYRGMHLSSVFQALFNARTLKAEAHEALLRVQNDSGQTLSPAAAFSIPSSAGDAVYFDRLCRIVHALNFVQQANAARDKCAVCCEINQEQDRLAVENKFAHCIRYS